MCGESARGFEVLNWALQIWGPERSRGLLRACILKADRHTLSTLWPLCTLESGGAAKSVSVAWATEVDLGACIAGKDRARGLLGKGHVSNPQPACTVRGPRVGV